MTQINPAAQTASQSAPQAPASGYPIFNRADAAASDFNALNTVITRLLSEPFWKFTDERFGVA